MFCSIRRDARLAPRRFWRAELKTGIVGGYRQGGSPPRWVGCFLSRHQVVVDSFVGIDGFPPLGGALQLQGCAGSLMSRYALWKRATVLATMGTRGVPAAFTC
jgi:hypothetical protein